MYVCMYENLHILWIHRNVNNSFKFRKPIGFDVLCRLMRSRTKDVHPRKKKFMSNSRNNHYCSLMKNYRNFGVVKTHKICIVCNGMVVIAR